MKQKSLGDIAYSRQQKKMKRDPEMHQAKKGIRWHLGMKCHTGVNTGNGFVHTVEATAKFFKICGVCRGAGTGASCQHRP